MIANHRLFIPYMSRTVEAFSKDNSFSRRADSRRQRMGKEDAMRSSPWLLSSLSEIRCPIHSEIARIIYIRSHTRILEPDSNKLYGNLPSYLSSLVRHGPFILRRKSRDRRSSYYLDTLIRWCPDRQLADLRSIGCQSKDWMGRLHGSCKPSQCTVQSTLCIQLLPPREVDTRDYMNDG